MVQFESKEIILKIETIFKNEEIQFNGNFMEIVDRAKEENQSQTAEVFSEKWVSYSKNVSKEEQERLWQFQKEWYLKLYGFDDERDLASFLKTKKVVFDAGCGLGYLSEWFARLSPQSTIVAMDISQSVEEAAKKYKDIPNIFFIRGDIAKTPFKDEVMDYISCHAVIMHTENPEKTFCEFNRILKRNNNSIEAGGGGELACYVYAKKALPRKLVDDYFRIRCKELSNRELWEMSEQLSELGKRLQDLNIKFEAPDIPLLGIKGGEYDIQRFIYWNFLKCFYNQELGWDTSVVTNFDWYSPSNAKRYTQEEFKRWGEIHQMKLIYFHTEEACFGARFQKK